MEEETTQPITITDAPDRTFENTNTVLAVAVFPDQRHMVTGSTDKMLRLWDMENGTDLFKKMEGHRGMVRAVTVSQARNLIASADHGDIIIWNRDTGESLTPAIKAHPTESYIRSLDFSLDGKTLVSGSSDHMTKLWDTETWQQRGNPINCNAEVYSVRYSPSGELLAIATTSDIQIWNLGTRECKATFKNRVHKIYVGTSLPLTWKPDGTGLLSGGCRPDPTIREWDLSTPGQQVGDPWEGHRHDINAIAMNSDGTLVASASTDHDVRLWRLWDRKTIAIFRHSSSQVHCVTFTADGKRILSGGDDKKISEWSIPERALCDVKILTINPCIKRDLSTAEELLTKEIDADPNNYNSYANRSFVMARKHDWGRALDDASKSLTIRPSLTGYISKGIALGGKKQVWDAIRAFDLASMFTNGDLNANHLLLLIKVGSMILTYSIVHCYFQAITLFNAEQHQEALLRVQELTEACPRADTRACLIVEAYLCLQLGIRASDNTCHDEAVTHFTAAIKASDSSSKFAIYSKYDDFVMLFGWDLTSLWETANKKRCLALLRASRLEEALEAHRYMMDKCNESTKANCLDWSTAFKRQCGDRYAHDGHAAFRARAYEEAINLYSAAINLGVVSDIILVRRGEAKLERMRWEDALPDLQQAIELNPSSYTGYKLKCAALRGLKRFNEAIDAFETMHKLGITSGSEIRKLHQNYLGQSKAKEVIQMVIKDQLENAPLRLINTTTGLLCDRDAQIDVFSASSEYIELLLSTMERAEHRTEHIEKVVEQYFRCVTLSHRWEGKEQTLREIQDRPIYSFDPVGTVVKLQRFCEVVRDLGYHWAWMDTCCIDKQYNVELEESLNSMFVWYRHSALTIVYLSDVRESGALTNSDWNRRGWTIQELLAPKVILFYQKDWTPYLDDHSSNHKMSTAIMQELGAATGIDQESLTNFHPSMSNAREKLKWASTRTTTRKEDIAYSLFGIFGVRLSVYYGEKEQFALGRLLQDIVAQSGDITALDWVGKPSKFNSCLPAEIASYQYPPYVPPPLSEDEIQTSVSSLRDVVSVDSASELYALLNKQSPPRFAYRRLQLPCMVFRVTHIRQNPTQDKQSYITYEVKADGLRDLSIKTKDQLKQFWPGRLMQTEVLLVRPWSRHLLELSALADESQSVEDTSEPQSALPDLSDGSLGEKGTLHLDSYSQALRLIVRLRQQFNALLLYQQLGGEYKRIASDHDIIAHVAEMSSIQDMMDVRTLEIL
ncbi:uncharacterized protein EDB93DRAFT_1217741 [Suillus bovinus]|uniref:uncharacterized protein n=1 Tax=Suillus bovinus TaxID=48563 RepID=UPI001B87A11C|nr:uncharacterized protein EDB93DRAFT_1217741 [Suillus bovinus]KAG2160226.1 hypothetical protein EDB93DRAFT_1217741 [Suillus bovinus]